jgi:pimeloyl-ACP methyl ester carboxylesterase
VVSEEVAQRAASLWKGLQVVRLPGAGHNVHREQYRPYALEVKRFLRKLR